LEEDFQPEYGPKWSDQRVERMLGALVLAVGAALPLTRDAFRDSRYDLAWPDAVLTASARLGLLASIHQTQGGEQ